jgi:hypothetical protein
MTNLYRLLPVVGASVLFSAASLYILLAYVSHLLLPGIILVLTYVTINVSHAMCNIKKLLSIQREAMDVMDRSHAVIVALNRRTEELHEQIEYAHELTRRLRIMNDDLIHSNESLSSANETIRAQRILLALQEKCQWVENLDYLGEAALLINDDCIIQHANKQAAALLISDQKDMIGEKISSVIPAFPVASLHEVRYSNEPLYFNLDDIRVTGTLHVGLLEVQHGFVAYLSDHRDWRTMGNLI